LFNVTTQLCGAFALPNLFYALLRPLAQYVLRVITTGAHIAVLLKVEVYKGGMADDTFIRAIARVCISVNYCFIGYHRRGKLRNKGSLPKLR
jgi:hypothetical protein